ncbi:hypothetical protein B9Z55_003393 [Caenorhabditis nigoni]|uniref:DUF7154 domain-containing protein n=1 Tax=Caenorhabditis nigoni TaxID=1611254 RepID=A0A2G5VQ39_9PELO|nr:hypothetical protein B9Z55_003393 [Caenorhabditis nigoni]
MDIQIDTNLDDATLTVQKNLPDPQQGFQNSSIGSNVFDVIEKFFSNTQAPVCGSNILVLLKRYPNEADISRLVSLIRYHHAVVHVITSTTPSGGSQPKAMYSVASKTNGMGLIENDEDFDRLAWYFSFYENPYPVYATTIQVSGSGTKTLPDFYNKGIIAKKYLIAITYQDHVPIDSFQKLNLRWTSPEGSGNYKIPRDSGKFRAIYFCPQVIEDLRRVNTISDNMQYNFAIDRLHFLNSDYKMTLDYNYTGSDVQNFQLRIYSSRDVNSTIPNNLPNPNQGFQNSSIGSNVFDVVEKFFSNTQAPVCGSRILVLLKRYPNEADTARLVSLIRSHHAILHVITSATPSGGSQPKTMYSVASKTNGMGLFEYDAYFYLTVMWFPLYGYPYPVYATTIQVSGSGTKTLPDFYPAIEDWYMLAITFQDHCEHYGGIRFLISVPDDSFQNLTLRWLNSQDSGNVSFNSIQIPTTGNYLAVGVYWHYLDYKMTLDYNYLDQDVQNLQIRIYSKIFSDDTSCNPTEQPQTFLFAYSNDLSSDTVLESWNEFSSYSIGYSWYGSVRIDSLNMNMKFHTNIEDVNSTIANNLPNPNQGYQNSSIGSNVFDVIEKFFSNTVAPVCGSRIVVLLKRYPNEVDNSRIVSIIRSHHAIVNVINSPTPSGGSQPKTMYSVSSKTNGMGAIEHDEYFYRGIWWFPLYGVNYPVYSTTIQVSGSGTKTLLNFHPIISDWCKIAITYQDHFPIDSFQNFNLRWDNPLNSGKFTFDLRESFGTYVTNYISFQNVDYKITLDYSYFGQDVENLQIRIYSAIPLNNWLPYSD